MTAFLFAAVALSTLWIIWRAGEWFWLTFVAFTFLLAAGDLFWASLSRLAA